MIVIAAKDGTYELTWTGKKWIDHAGGVWHEAKPGWSYDFVSEKHGQARTIEGKRSFTLDVTDTPQYIRDGRHIYDNGSLRVGRRK